MNKIKDIKAFSLLDSRGTPTLGVHLALSDGSKGFSIVPSGASTGKHEAVELRDNDPHYFLGKSVNTAKNNVNDTIFTALFNKSFSSQEQFDNALIALDGTKNKSNLGANALLGVSLAFARAVSASKKVPLYRYMGGEQAKSLPTPMLNILNGGAHAKNNLDIQEFMIVPKGIENFGEQLRASCEIYGALKNILNKSLLSTSVGDEGGFAPNLESETEALDLICEAIKTAGYSEKEIKIALDIASSEWVKDDGYFLPKAKQNFTATDLINRYNTLCNSYPIVSIEDGLGEDDFTNWQTLTNELGSKIMLVGDDLFVTNKERLTKGISEKIGNSILIKLNQIGTLSETLEVINIAKKHGYKPIVSHRSGDSEDSFIADLAVATNSPCIKTGAPCRSERTAKYNRLLLIENEIKGIENE